MTKYIFRSTLTLPYKEFTSIFDAISYQEDLAKDGIHQDYEILTDEQQVENAGLALRRF